MTANVADTGVAPGLAEAIAEIDWEAGVVLVRRAGRILVCAHMKPDGDAIGSLLGLAHALESAGKRVTTACADPPDEALAKLPGAESIVLDLAPLYTPGEPLPWDLVIVVDSSGLDRLGALYERSREVFERLPVIDLDHHFTNDRFGEVNLVDSGAASATEVVTLFLERLGIRPNTAAATCLLAGLMTDSLSFQTETTTPRSLRTAAALVEAGAPLAALAFQLFRQRPVSSALLWSQALGTLQFAAGGRIAWIEVTRPMLEAAGSDADSNGLSGFAGSITGVDVGLSFTEAEDGKIYVGLRSHTVDVAALAAQFGGGGHKRAAGCQFTPPVTLPEARERLLSAAEAALPPHLDSG